MAPGHARLSPSSAKRWLTCPGSVGLSAHVPNVSGAPADEGTACHRMLEAHLKESTPIRSWVGKTIQVVNEQDDGPATVSYVLVRGEMADWVQSAADWVEEYCQNEVESGNQPPHVQSEMKVHVGRVFGCPDDLWGTSDVVIDAGEELVVADLKAGYNEVSVEENEQLLLYVIGAMNEYGWVHSQARLVILQPRCGEPKVKVYTIDQIRDYQKRFAPKIALALQPDGALVKSDEGCKWCPAAGVCPKLQEENLKLAQREFTDESIRLLPEEKLLLLLEHSARIRAALDSAERHALSLIRAGHSLPGWKVVSSDKRRTWKPDQEGAAQVVLETEYGLSLDEVAPRKLATPPQVAEKLAAKLPWKTKSERVKRARDMVFTWTEIPKGEPTLAREDDKRPSLKPGAEFEEVTP